MKICVYISYGSFLEAIDTDALLLLSLFSLSFHWFLFVIHFLCRVVIRVVGMATAPVKDVPSQLFDLGVRSGVTDQLLQQFDAVLLFHQGAVLASCNT